MTIIPTNIYAACVKILRCKELGTDHDAVEAGY